MLYKLLILLTWHVSSHNLTACDVLCYSGSMISLIEKLRRFELDLLEEALRDSNGVQAHAAKKLGISKRSMYYRLSRLQMKPDSFRNGRAAALPVLLRFRVLRRDGFKCRYCGQSPPRVALEVDHVIPVARGGRDEMRNLVAACFQCNHGKRDDAGLLVDANGVLAEDETFDE